jgi:tetratricopeptide (TPR) repeat protein
MAQPIGPAGTLASEIQRLDALIQDVNNDGVAKKDALSAKAQLFETMGNIEEAAKIWNEAVFAEANKRDDEALLRSAVCFTAMGEYSQADAALKIILLTGIDAVSLKDARYLAAQIEVLRDGEKAFPVLLSFLENPDYESSRAGIYYLLWMLSGDETYKAKLIADFPESMEAALAQDEDNAIVPTFTPMWLLFPGREQLVIPAPTLADTTDDVPADTPNMDVSDSANQSPVLIQVGLYGRQENAAAMIDRLKEKGFTGTISQKTVSGTSYWQVTLPPEQDSNRTIMTLKDAGFESFPVFSD